MTIFDSKIKTFALITLTLLILALTILGITFLNNNISLPTKQVVNKTTSSKTQSNQSFQTQSITNQSNSLISSSTNASVSNFSSITTSDKIINISSISTITTNTSVADSFPQVIQDNLFSINDINMVTLAEFQLNNPDLKNYNINTTPILDFETNTKDFARPNPINAKDKYTYILKDKNLQRISNVPIEMIESVYNKNYIMYVVNLFEGSQLYFTDNSFQNLVKLENKNISSIGAVDISKNGWFLLTVEDKNGEVQNYYFSADKFLNKEEGKEYLIMNEG